MLVTKNYFFLYKRVFSSILFMGHWDIAGDWQRYAPLAAAGISYMRNWRARNGGFAKHARKSGRGMRGMRKKTRQRSRRKWPRPSFTKTMRRPSGSGTGSAGAFSYVRVNGLGRKRHFLGRVQRALASKGKYVELGSQRLDTASNRQGTRAILFYTSEHVRNMFAQVNGTSPNEGNKLYINGGSIRYQLVNQANIMGTVWIYDCVFRRDAQQAIDPVDDWEQGIDAEGGSNLDYTLPFVTPYQSKRFCSRYLIKRCTKFMLAPGEEHIHTVGVACSSSINMTRVFTPPDAEEASAHDYVGGLTHFSLFVALGGVYNDENDKFDVGYSPIAIDIAYTFKSKHSALFDDKVRFTQVNNLPTIADGNIMVEVDADPSAVIAA